VRILALVANTKVKMKREGKRFLLFPPFLILNLLDFLDKGLMTTLIDHELVGTKKKEEDSN